MTKQTDKATARPWKYRELQQGVSLLEADGDGNFASGNKFSIQITTANAALIVRAVNEYDALNAIAEAANNALNDLNYFVNNDKWPNGVCAADIASVLNESLAAIREGGAK